MINIDSVPYTTVNHSRLDISKVLVITVQFVTW